ncbi:MAG: hypothetical protein VW516_05925 [Rhodospirillaceae bacterium]
MEDRSETVTLFICTIGQVTVAEPAGKLLEALVHGLWSGHEERPRIKRWSLVRKGFEVVTDGALADADRVAIERACSDYDAAIDAGLAAARPAA